MLTCKHSPLLNNTWPQLCNLWIALLSSPFSEKNSIIKCMESIRKQLSQSFMFFPLEDRVSSIPFGGRFRAQFDMFGLIYSQVSIKATECARNLSSLPPEQWDASLYRLDVSENHAAFHRMISDLLNSADNGMK